jgi:TetR/AcrR family transcriptional regulator, regulator of cefoperazone and chloramphenicol sensitivity
MSVRSSLRDGQVRQRLLETAAHLFAQRGFKNVRVRDISHEAATNVAAIHYHFGDKLGLYEEVIKFAAVRMESTRQNAMRSGKPRSPEDQLRKYVQLLLRHLMGADEDSWMDKLISHEMADPTPGLDLIVGGGIKPHTDCLRALVSQILKCSGDDQRVWQCAISIQAQCFFYNCSGPVFTRMAPGLKLTPEVIDRLAKHIADFSLAGIRSIASEREAKAKPGMKVP